MSDISGELRKFTNTYHLNSLQVYELNHIANRIDAETVKLPKDRKGRTLRLGYEVLVFNGTSTCGQGEVTSLTLAMMDPAAWYMGAVGGRSYRTSCDGFRPDELERIEEGIDGND